MRERGAHHEPDARRAQQHAERDQHRRGHRHHEQPVARQREAEHGHGRAVEQRRHRRRQRREAPRELRALADQVGQPEGQQQLAGMTARLHAAQQPALAARAEQPDRERREHERGPEPRLRGDAVADVRAEHVEARVREVQHALHAEDQRQAGRQHEQQQAVAEAVEGLEREPVHRANRQAASGSSAARSASGSATGRRVPRSTYTCTKWPCAAGAASPAANSPIS
ncbi:hypothetical protein FEQ02_06600 [Burkholderia pseudomultivorans]|nr:hypothetical protein [Burkholderia pseudomultivorans]